MRRNCGGQSTGDRIIFYDVDPKYLLRKGSILTLDGVHDMQTLVTSLHMACAYHLLPWRTYQRPSEPDRSARASENEGGLCRGDQ